MVVSFKESTRFHVFLLSQNASPPLYKEHQTSTTFFMFLQSTPHIQTTILLLLVLLDATKAQTTSFVTTYEVFLLFKWSFKPTFKLSMITWFSFSFHRSQKYFETF
jgi:hypothetical protein